MSYEPFALTRSNMNPLEFTGFSNIVSYMAPSTQINSFILMLIFSYSLLHIADQFNNKGDSQFVLSIIWAFKVSFDHNFS